MKIICFMYVSAINCTHIHSSFYSPLFVYFCCPITPSERTQWFWVLLQSFYNDKTNLGLTRSKGTHSQSWSIIIYPFNKCLQHSTPYFLYRQLCSFRVYIAQCFVPHTQSYVYTVGLMCVFGPLHKPGIAMLCFLRIMMTLYTFLIDIIIMRNVAFLFGFVGLRDDVIFSIHPLMHMTFPQDMMPKCHREKIKRYTALIKNMHLTCRWCSNFLWRIKNLGDRYTLCEHYGLLIVRDLSTSLSQGVSVRNFCIQSLLCWWWYSDGWWHIMNYANYYTIGRVILCSDSGLWAW